MKVSDHANFADLYMFNLDRLLEVLPENIFIVKDSGTWSLHDDNAELTCLMCADCSTGLKELIIHYLLSLEYDEIIAWNWYKLYE